MGRHTVDDLANLIERVVPVGASNENVIEVPEPLSGLFVSGGLKPGWILSVKGSGYRSLALLLAAAAAGSNGWTAVVGVTGLGLLAAAELGVDLDRTIIVEPPGAALWGEVVAALLESTSVVLASPGTQIRSRDARRVTARAKEQQTTLILIDQTSLWPEPVDIELNTTAVAWSGLGQGYGHLQQRLLKIGALGRRSANKVRTVNVLLPSLEKPVSSVSEPARLLTPENGSEPVKQKSFGGI